MNLDMHEKAQIESEREALSLVNSMGIPKTIQILPDSFVVFGSRMSNDARRQFDDVSSTHGDHVSDLIGVAVRELWYSLHRTSRYLSIMLSDAASEMSPDRNNFSTAEKMGDWEGYSYTLYNQLSEIDEHMAGSCFRVGTPFVERLSIEDILAGISLYFFSEAARCCEAGDMQNTFKWISEAYNAISLKEGVYMWNEGEKTANESFSESLASVKAVARSDLARKAAHAKHKENRSMKAEVFLWLDINMRDFASKDAAAESIMRLQPIRFRTARDWIDDWGKARSASTP